MRESRVKCDSCGRTAPRYKSAPVVRRVFGELRKVYYCISCAKHRGIKLQEAKEKVRRGPPRRRARRSQ